MKCVKCTKGEEFKLAKPQNAETYEIWVCNWCFERRIEYVNSQAIPKGNNDVKK